MDKHEFESYKEAGRIAGEVKKFALEYIQPGMKLIDIAIAIDDKIEELGGEPAFPVNLSMDDVAAHFTPTMDSEEVASGLLKFDVGVHVDGFIADTAVPIDLTENNEHTELIELNKSIMQDILGIVKPGFELQEIGNTVTRRIAEHNQESETQVAIVKALSGHQLAQNIIHAGFTVSNFANENSTQPEETAMAVEPFLSYGSGEIYNGEGGGIYALENMRSVRDPYARKLLAYIVENYSTRPFCARWMERAGLEKVKYALSYLVREKVLHHYPLLMEKTKKAVSQVENTFIVSAENNYYGPTTYVQGV